jgi:hypothetical protein
MSYHYEQLVSHRGYSPYMRHRPRQSSPAPVSKQEIKQEIITRVYKPPVPLSVTRDFIEESKKEGWRFGEKLIMKLEPSEVEAALKFYKQTVPNDPTDAKRKLCDVLRKMYRISILDR